MKAITTRIFGLIDFFQANFEDLLEMCIRDRSSGVYQDQGIPELQQWLEQALVDPFEVETRLIPDEQPLICLLYTSRCV